MALLAAVRPVRASTVSGSVFTTFISDEKLVCDCGNSIQDETIDYSVDVGLFVLAARWFAAFSLFVLAPFAAFRPCGSTHSLELRSFPGLGFQQCNFDGLCDLGGLSACLVDALMVKLTGTQLLVLILLACACGSLCTLASDDGSCLPFCELDGSCLRILLDGSHEKGRCSSLLVSSGVDVFSSFSALLLLQPGDRACSSCV